MTITAADLSQFTYNPIFVETGTHYGGGVKRAESVGFAEIHSAEVLEKQYEYCKERFRGVDHVHLYFGDSATMLIDMLAQIKVPATIMLDAHCGGVADIAHDNVAATEYNPLPIMAELSVLANDPIKTHTIIIDDRRLFTKEDETAWHHVTEQDIYDALDAINPEYQIHYLNAAPASCLTIDDRVSDIIVAIPPGVKW